MTALRGRVSVNQEITKDEIKSLHVTAVLLFKSWKKAVSPQPPPQKRHLDGCLWTIDLLRGFGCDTVGKGKGGQGLI